MRATAAHPAPPPSLPPPAEESPPHAPEESWATRLLGPVRVTGIFWYRIHRFGMRVVPEWALPGLIFLFTALFWVVLRRIRAAIASNLEPVLGPCGFRERQRRMFRTFHQYAWCLSERYERLTTAPPVAIEADHPAMFVTASNELSQEYREFERCSTVVANAYIGPIIRGYVGEIDERIRADGFDGSFLIVQSTGGLYEADEAKRQCIRMLESGPAAGVIGTQALCRTLELEEGTDVAEHAGPLRALGHEVRVVNLNSGLHGIVIEYTDDTRVIYGGVDPRREGVALGD